MNVIKLKNFALWEISLTYVFALVFILAVNAIAAVVFAKVVGSILPVIAKKIGLTAKDLELHGDYMAKIKEFLLAAEYVLSNGLLLNSERASAELNLLKLYLSP